jgi:hypothetical protein
MKTFAYAFAVLLVSAGYIAAGLTISTSRDAAANAEERAKEAREAFETASARAADSEALLRDARKDAAACRAERDAELHKWEASEEALKKDLAAEETAHIYHTRQAADLARWWAACGDRLEECRERHPRASCQNDPELAGGAAVNHPARPGDPNDMRPEVRP